MDCKLISRSHKSAFGLFLSIVTIVASFAITACGGGNANGGEASTSGAVALPGANSVGSGGQKLTIAMRYIALTDGNGSPVATQSQVQSAIDHMNAVWGQCAIAFKLTEYKAENPNAIGARYNPANYTELDAMRISTQNDSSFEIIGTGTWDRTGDLGSTGSNCFSSFPGDSAQGIVCEYSQAASPSLFSHEVGHWLNLIHTDDPTTDLVDDTNWNNVGANLMSHFVAPANTDLTAGQCLRARQSIVQSRRSAVIAN